MDFDSFVLAAATADLGDAALASDHADALEYRMDLADRPLESLARYDGPLPVLATNRVAWEGGEAPDAPARLDALEEAVRHERVEAIDVELDALEGKGEGDAGRLLEVAAANDAAIVVSTHDFESTPDPAAIGDRLDRACEYGDVGKIAVTARDRDDVLGLLGVTRQFDADGRRVATMAMGEAGRHSRAVAPIYGSKIGYAPVDPDDATAPGQYDLATLRGLIDDLESRE